MRRAARLLAVALLLALLGAACSGDDSGDEGAEAVDAMAPEVREDAAQAPTADTAAEGEVGLADGEEAAADDGDGATDPAEGAAAPSGPSQAPDGTAATGERIIKEGTVTLAVDPGEFDAAFGQVVARAQALGGHVAGTSSSTMPLPERSPDGAREDGDPAVLTSGQVTLRIPVRSFEDLLTSLGEAGEVTDRSITSQDVTAEFTDLESRRRNLEAQERFYLGLLDQATTVEDAIRVQQQLDDVTGQIEQITGRLNLLADRSAFSTLTVRIAERGAEPVDPAVDAEPGGLTPYVQDAADTLVATVGSLLVVATFLLPFLVLALAGYAVWRAVRARRPVRTAVPAAQPRPEQADQPLVTSGAGVAPGPGANPPVHD